MRQNPQKRTAHLVQGTMHSPVQFHVHASYKVDFLMYRNEVTSVQNYFL